MPGLRDILDAATPGPWVVQKKPPWIAGRITHEDATLIALAPELAALVLDMGEALLWTDNSLSHVLAGRPHRAIAEVHSNNAALLARLDQLGKEPSDG